MAGWQIGLVLMMAVGVAVILFGALWDRERSRRRADQLMRPPDRPIPGFAGDDPTYVTSQSAPPGGDRPLGEAERSALQVRLKSAIALDASLAAGAFVSDPVSGWAILEHPQVLVCAEPVETLRELLTFLDRAAGTKRAIVVVAPGFDDQTRDTLVVNHLYRALQVIAVTAPTATLNDVAAATRATPLTRADLQAGWIPENAIGSAETWVSSRDHAWALASRDTPLSP